MKRGFLKLMVTEVVFNKDTKFSPYINIEFLGKQEQTRKLEDVPNRTYFNDTFNFEVTTDADIKLKLTAMDKGVFSDSVVGEATVNLDFFFTQKNQNHTTKVMITKKNQQRGYITLQLRFSQSYLARMCVNVVSGNLTNDTQAFGKMDPYVILKLGEQVNRTSVKKDAGKEPVWNQILNFDLLNLYDPLHVQVWDEDVGKPDEIGKGICQFKPLSKTATEYSVALSFNGKEAGSIKLLIEFKK